MNGEIVSAWAIVLQLGELQIRYRIDGLAMLFKGQEYLGFAKAEDVHKTLIQLAQHNGLKMKGIKACPACDGQGVVVENPMMAVRGNGDNMRPCKRCYGAGYGMTNHEGIVDIPRGRN